ncbi:MMPL family transporter [Massilia dura]|uniref:MMPL family transporter n=1 Tax=Pseudoduganella dura TaxID=321982 RepID=A0A6I3X2G1_9BURK|nr:MMPL family transporter [Pseudoduganella dura]MUI10999.1 MMPL family transporter [Pseudoduganella dura]GGY18455.1 RND transporter [Pseudoduganella dura]
MSFGASASEQAVVRDLSQFDTRSGSALERLLFNHRLLVALACLLATLVLGWQATRLKLNASFEDMIPSSHPYIANYLQHRDQLSGLGNAVRIAVEAKHGTVYDARYLATLQKISDELFLIPGVDRTYMKSLWTPSTRWVGVTEDGMEGGPVIPNDYDGSARSVAQVRDNVARSGEIGQLVAVDGRSSILYVPLLDRGADGKALDYAALGARLEQLRAKYAGGQVDLHIVGFAKVAGDLIEGLRQVLLFFAASTLIAAAMLYWYTRCARSTLLVVACSLVAVVWQLGLLPLLGYGLDPYSMLVPFLVFAIGMSHGAQKMNGIMQDIGRGTHRLVAARYTFRRLFLAGLAALLCDAVGFAVLAIIDIKVIKDLAAVASIGVAALILTNLILLPILLSWLGVDGDAARRSLRAEEAEGANESGREGGWHLLERFTERRTAAATIAVAAVLGAGGYYASLHVKIGDLDPGAPELRPDSRYNRDNAYVVGHYAASSDVFAVMVKTPDNACAAYDTLMRVDALEYRLSQLPAVETTGSLALLNRRVITGLNEGSLKWYELLQNQDALNMVTAGAPRGLYNDTCNLLTLYAYLTDHKADTLAGVVKVVEDFARDNDTKDVKFLLAAGNAGIEAATNIVVRDASRAMLYWVYAAVIVLCLVTFRSWRAVVCAVVPLVLTSVLCEALMVWLGIGIKVATLPVIALGVGIGIDYALYVMSILLARQKAGDTLREAYSHALRFTGKVVLLTGVTLAIAVATWALSPIKFQADMGILLAFMFLWNMVGALVLLPALASFLMPSARRQGQAAPAGIAARPVLAD